ncbi:MAG TPA: ATP-binding protein [Planctomycetota bacterium]|nr:ATP-binding protein [Planctomycetota bacterium]
MSDPRISQCDMGVSGRGLIKDDVLGQLPALVSYHRPDGSVEAFSQRFINYTGLTEEALANRDWTCVLHTDDREAALGRWRTALGEGTEYEAEIRVRRADGEYRWFILRAVPARADSGGIGRWIGLWTDIDVQKRAERGLRSFKADLERRIQDRNEQLEEALRELEGFSYTVAHDLRAPLRAIHSFGQILREDCRGVLDERALDYLKRMMEASRRMDLLVTDLLAYSRLSRQDLSLYPMELGPLVDELLQELDAEARERRSRIRVERPLLPVFANGVALSMAIRNLLSNAIKYVANGVPPEIRIRSEARNGRIRIWVEDNGIGIEPEYHERIFRVFERLHPAEVYSGTGIGLAIVRRAMDRMAGTAGVESAPGAGSRFWIELPRAVALFDRTPAS